MSTYLISIEQVIGKTERGYDEVKKVYTQVVEDINLPKLITYINQGPAESPKRLEPLPNFDYSKSPVDGT